MFQKKKIIQLLIKETRKNCTKTKLHEEKFVPRVKFAHWGSIVHENIKNTINAEKKESY